MNKPSLYGFPLNDLKDLLKQAGLAAFGADQIYNWVYKRLIFNPDEWTNVAKKTREYVKAELSLELPTILWQGVSQDGTRKYLMGFHDQQSVETVVIPARDRLTICLSSQVGCAIGCTFCHTGTMGFKRHLSAGEVVGQWLAVSQWLAQNVSAEAKLTNIVYMGQGEPLHNYENMRKATMVFLEDKGLGLGQRRVTLSTSGLVPQIEKLWNFPPVNIAISLHASHDQVRDELMPINKVYDLKRLLDAIKKIPLKAHRHITYEYLLIKDLNDREEDLIGLVNLLDKSVSKINLIPFNEYPQSQFKRPSDEKIKWFQEYLLKRGYVCTIRATKGQDILAACGQLKSEKDKLNLWQSDVLSLQV